MEASACGPNAVTLKMPAPEGEVVVGHGIRVTSIKQGNLTADLSHWDGLNEALGRQPTKPSDDVGYHVYRAQATYSNKQLPLNHFWQSVLRESVQYRFPLHASGRKLSRRHLQFNWKG